MTQKQISGIWFAATHYTLGKGLFSTGEGIRLFGISCLTPRFLFFHTPYVDRAEYSSALGLKMNYFEIIFIQFLHLLAHHPDFSVTRESLPDMAKCVCLLPFTTVSYMILVLDISSFTSSLWLRQKIFRYCIIYQERQRPSVTQNPIGIARFVGLCTSAKLKLKECQNLYALSELAQHIIKDMAKRHSWTLQSFPMKVKLPTGILRPLPNAEAANKVLSVMLLTSAT